LDVCVHGAAFEAGGAEVDDLDAAVLLAAAGGGFGGGVGGDDELGWAVQGCGGEEDVLWFEVTVDDACFLHHA